VVEAGWTIVRGARAVEHPVGPAPASVSLAKQAGNADDVLMGALHGRGWRVRAGVPAGRRPRHLATVAAAAACGTAAIAGRRMPAALAGAAWAAGTAELAWARIAPGPRTLREVVAMAWTSALLPFWATGWWLRGRLRLRATLAEPGPTPDPKALRAAPAMLPVFGSGPGSPDRTAESGDAHAPAAPPPAAVFFDRDGTLVVDVPYNGDPARVRLAPGARAAVQRLREAGIPTAVVSNQSGIARGLLTDQQVHAVNARIEELLGPLGGWHYCPHGPEDGCTCRKPEPGLVLRAARHLGVDPARCAVVGDIGADVEAALAAGARAVLVPTPETLPEEVAAAPEVAADLEDAVDRLLRSAA
jgi:histidinol-phosphate phosphatase family protein